MSQRSHSSHSDSASASVRSATAPQPEKKGFFGRMRDKLEETNEAAAARAKEKAEAAEVRTLRPQPTLSLRPLNGAVAGQSPVTSTGTDRLALFFLHILQKKRLQAEEAKRDMMERKLAEAAAKRLRDAEEQARKEAVRFVVDPDPKRPSATRGGQVVELCAVVCCVTHVRLQVLRSKKEKEDLKKMEAERKKQEEAERKKREAEEKKKAEEQKKADANRKAWEARQRC
jgi:hypothetical protein